MLEEEGGSLAGYLDFDEANTAAPLLVFIHGGGCDSRYFDLRGFSVIDAAIAQGFACLAVDRPGHGGSAAQGSGSLFEISSRAVAKTLAVIRRRHGLEQSAIGLCGHSIGGAVALHLAADLAEVQAVAVSGLGEMPSPKALTWFDETEPAAEVAPPRDFFFGPEGSYSWRGPTALRQAARPWLQEEVRELLFDWPTRFEALAAKIAAPVQWRLSENEFIWRSDDEALAALVAAFPSRGTVDVARLPGGGHLYELHRAAPAYVASQLAFFHRTLGATK